MAILLAAGMGLASCTSHFEDLNTDPNRPTKVDPAQQFGWTIAKTAGDRYENWRGNLIYSSCMIQHFAGTTMGWSGDYYTLNMAYNNAQWERNYGHPVKNIEQLDFNLQKLAEEEGREIEEEMALVNIWKVFVYHRLTDLYGPVPFSEAGRGYTEGIINPRYDSEQTIYLGDGEVMGMLEMLDEAAITLEAAGGSNVFGNADIMFQGDAQKWAKFANSMILRLGMRISGVAESEAKAFIQKAIERGVMESNMDIAYIEHEFGNDPYGLGNNGVSQVFLENSGASGHDFRFSESFMNVLKHFNTAQIDPRLEYITGVYNAGFDNGQYFETYYPFDGSAPTSYDGLPNGLEPVQAQALAEEKGFDELFTSGIGHLGFPQPNRTYMTTREAPTIFMSYAETEFLLAEIAVRFPELAQDANGHYQNGIVAAMEMLDLYSTSGALVPRDEIQNYVNSLPVLGGNNRSPLELESDLDEIHTQKWLALLFNGYEAYAEWRRTQLPSFVTNSQVNHPQGITNGRIPGRLKYPDIEQGTNGASWAKAVDMLSNGEDTFLNDLWWAKKNF